MNSFKSSVLAYIIAAISLVACSGEHSPSESHGDDHVAHWGYEADNGPANWGSIDKAWRACAEGRKQSPIDLANATETELPEAEIDQPSAVDFDALSQAGSISAIDNGHTIQINAKTGATITIGDKAFSLLQFHFHAPSEHTIDSKHFPMEMHFVHQTEDGALAVVGVLVEEGAPNPGLAPIWTQLAGLTDTETRVQIPSTFAESVFPDDTAGSYHYEGSLTTPPCSEGVKWYIRKSPAQFSAGQIAAFTAIYNHNNRPVQPLNDRTLYQDD